MTDWGLGRSNRSPSSTICVTGASGFIGSHLVPLLPTEATVRVLTRSSYPNRGGVDVFVGDLLDAPSLGRFMAGADLLINLAQPAASLDFDLYCGGVSNLARIARDSGVRRVLHISTAMVVGATSAGIVTEETQARPRSLYERQKYGAEQILRNELGAEADLGVLRPTAVFGEGGLNLLKLAGVIAEGGRLKRSLLRVFHGKRRMHLVSVNDVVEAILYLAFLPQSLAGNIFLISADDEPSNNYQAVDAIFGDMFGNPLPPSSFSLPTPLLGVLLRMAGRSQSDPSMVYDSSKIRKWGYSYKSDFTEELKEFFKAYMKAKGD